MYEYRAELIKVVDGDTVRLNVKLGCDVTVNLTFRLYGIDAPEMNTEAGKASKTYLEDLLKGYPIIVQTYKDRREKYGRYLGDLYVQVGEELVSVRDELISSGHAGSRTYSEGQVTRR